MKTNLLFTILTIVITLYSCEKKCSCESVVYESTFETNYEWVESSRKPTNECSEDSVSSTFLDSNGNISYVRTVLECN